MSICFVLLLFGLSSSSCFLSELRSTRLVNRTRLTDVTECAVRVGDKDFTLKYFRLVSCRFVTKIETILPFLSQHLNESKGLELVDSTIEFWRDDSLRNLEFLILHRTRWLNFSRCPLESLSKSLFYLHLNLFNVEFSSLFDGENCSSLKKVHVLLIDRSPVGEVEIIPSKLFNVHLLSLNSTKMSKSSNFSSIRSLKFLSEVLFRSSVDCHRCEFDWLKMLARGEIPSRFRLNRFSSCVDWSQQGKSTPWSEAPLCGFCSLFLDGKFCRVENGITEFYCRAFYGSRAVFNRTRRSVDEFSFVTKRPIDFSDRKLCPKIEENFSPPKVRRNFADEFNDFLLNVSQTFASNCSAIDCRIESNRFRGEICATNGKTFENLCEFVFEFCSKKFDVEQMQIDYLGRCVNNCSMVKRCFDDRQICLMTPNVRCVKRKTDCEFFQPVCDVEGKTFVHRCHLSNSLKFHQPRVLAYRGPCRPNAQCSEDLCETNETCLTSIDRRRTPVCLDCRTKFSCHFELFCADNGKQYVSRCQLHNDRCQTQTFIQIAHFGLCREKKSTRSNFS